MCRPTNQFLLCYCYVIAAAAALLLLLQLLLLSVRIVENELGGSEIFRLISVNIDAERGSARLYWGSGGLRSWRFFANSVHI